MSAAVVTGGANGIGMAVAKRLAEGGFDLGILDIEDDAGSLVAAEIERETGRAATFVHCDVSDEGSVEEAVESTAGSIGTIDSVVHCAGANTYGNPLAVSVDEFDAAIALNLRSAWLVARAVVPHLPPTGGSIVLISSVHAFQTRVDRFPYPVAKAGMVGLARSLALDLGSRNIRVNAICPGIVRTRLLDQALDEVSDAGAELARLERAQPIGRIGEPHDIAGIAHFLVGPEATFITGSAIVVDGGLTAMLPG